MIKKRFLIFIPLFLYVLTYPMLISNPGFVNFLQYEVVPYENETQEKIKYDTGSVVNVGVSDSVTFSMTHEYLGFTFPVYIGKHEMRLWNNIWFWSVILLILDLIYILGKNDYGNRTPETSPQQYQPNYYPQN